MVSSAARTTKEYLDQLPAERRAVIAAVRKVIRRNLPAGYEERMNWGMISYEVPLHRYPDTYNGRPMLFAALAAQKHYCALYLTPVYAEPDLRRRLERAFKAASLKLDMGKSCIRFRSPADLPLEEIGRLIAGIPIETFIRRCRSSRRGERRPSARPGKKSPPARRR
jgi:hypothetical protein